MYRESPAAAVPDPVGAAESNLLSQTPLSWRLGIAAGCLLLVAVTWSLQSTVGPRGQALAGMFVFFGVVAMISRNLRTVNWRTIVWGLALQLMLALLVLKGKVQVGDSVYSVQEAIKQLGLVFKSLIGFSDRGAEFVFGNLARPGDLARTFALAGILGKDFLFPFAFKALPSILFASALFTVLFHLGVLQWCVRLLGRAMTLLMQTSGAETLSVAANVFMGQTESPLIVKHYVPRMTNSELFTLMVSGFAHISGGMMFVYINYGADPTAVLTTCVMACPCSLYLSKLFLPELGIPETSGTMPAAREKSPYVNVVDAAASGTTDGMRLALNVAAMLIVFIAFVALFDAMLSGIKPVVLGLGVSAEAMSAWPDDLSLEMVFGWLFAPAAFLIGVESQDVQHVGSLLGSKLAINEHYAYLQYKFLVSANPEFMTERSKVLTAFALTGFANFASVGVQLGGIGSIAPDRRQDLARLGASALFVGFTATLLNAAVAGVLL